MELRKKRCLPCEQDTQPLDEKSEQELLGNLTDWEIKKEKEHYLTKTISTKSFKDAVILLSDIASIAERENHHPDMHLYYNKLKIDIWTHKIGGLSENDFILGAKIDELLYKKNMM